MDAVLLMSEMFLDEGLLGDRNGIGAADFSDGVVDVSGVGKGVDVLDFRLLEGTCAYCAPDSEAELASRLSVVGPEGVHFIDGGDYHYLSEILLRSVAEPFELLLWDNHPDDQEGAFGSLFAEDSGDGAGSGLLSCGNWVKRLRETCPFCRGTHWFKSAEDFGKWRSEDEGPVSGENGQTRRESIDATHGTLPVYFSIDLDVLRREDARTNWDQGSMTLVELCREIRLAMDSRRVIGADICGGISASKGGRACDFSINAGIRQTLYELLRGR